MVLGSGFLSDTLLSSLRDEKRDLQHQINGLNDQKNALNEKLSAANNFDTQMVGRDRARRAGGQVGGGVPHPGCPDDDVAAVSKIVGQAGGTVTGTVSLTQEFVDANSAEKLLYGGELVDRARRHAAEHQARRPGFAGRRPAGHRPADQRQPGRPAVDDTQRDTVLAALRDTGFITYQPSDHIGAANAALIVTGGGLAAGRRQSGRQRGPVRRRAGAARLGHAARRARRFGDRNRRGRGDPRRRRHELARSAPSTTSTPQPGRITAVLGLHDLINGGHAGQYGTGHGATSITVPQ